MASIIPGYEYDIFISYRQKDNKYDGWVSEFINNLKKELEATFKEDISIYFDKNPHDGILDTYNINKSLENKIKCIIFIPIISQTYCDPKSFAWQNEFIVFNKAARNDLIGSNIKLTNGNVIGRILPVKIHDLDKADRTILESELGGSFRAVEFIFKSPGVNRPLKPDDSRTENLNHTYYRDQINKVANTAKEIITALNFNDDAQNDLDIRINSINKSGQNKTKKLSFKIGVLSFFLLAVAVLGYFLLQSKNVEKSIAVLPFENMSNEPNQDDYAMNEIMNNLFKIGGLQIPSSTSSMRFKNLKLSVKEIARKLNVTYVLEGSVSKSDNNIRIFANLVRGKNERLVWSRDYNKVWTATNLQEIYSDIAQNVAEKMGVEIAPDVRKRIKKISTENTEAYTLFLQANNNMKEGLISDKERVMLERAISLDPHFADAYALLATWWINRAEGDEGIKRQKVLEEVEPRLAKALSLDKNSYLAHSSLVTLRLWYYWDFQSAEKETQIINALTPSTSSFYNSHIDYLLASGKYHEALSIAQKIFNIDRAFNLNWVQLATALYFNDKQDSAITTIETALRLFPSDFLVVGFAMRIDLFCSRYSDIISLYEKNSKVFPYNSTGLQCALGIAYFKTGNVTKADSILNEILIKCNISASGSPAYFGAALYTAMEKKDKAFSLLEKAYNDRNLEMYWLKVDPLFRILHDDSRFDTILNKIGFK